MSKRKKKKPIKRPHLLPKDWLYALADKLHITNPSKVIIFNTISSIFCKAYTAGYIRRGEDDVYFRTRQEKHILDDWNIEKDKFDDDIHEKSQR